MEKEKEHDNPSTSEADGSASATSPPAEEVAQTTGQDLDGATSSETTPAGASAAATVRVNDKVAVESDNSHVFNESWSKLPKDVIIDKIKGVIYGQAIGDAFGIIYYDTTNCYPGTHIITMLLAGLATEFITHKEAKRYYKQGPSGYADIIPDMHRQRYTTHLTFPA